jgi:hypothetical protein
MQKSIVSMPLFGALVLGSVANNVIAAPDNGSVLGYGDGSRISLEVTPGYWMDVAVKGDPGLAIGADQSDESIDGPFIVFGYKAHHMTTGPITAVSATELDFSNWRLVWNDQVIDIGGGSAQISCESDCGKGDNYTLEYSAVMPADAGALAGLPYRLNLAGKVQ